MMTIKDIIRCMTDMQAEYEFEHFCDIDYINTMTAEMERIANDMLWAYQF